MSYCCNLFVLSIFLSLPIALVGCETKTGDVVSDSNAVRSCGEAVEMGENAIANGGGEADNASEGEVVEVTCWSREQGCFTVMDYEDGYGGFDSVRPQDAGDNLLSGGKNCDEGNSTSKGVQTLGTEELSSVVEDFSSGEVNFELSGYLGGWQGQDDSATVTVRFLDDGGSELSTASIGPITSDDRGGETSFLERSTTGTVPSGTASVEVILTAEKTGGSNNDGVVDNLRLVFTN